MRLRARRRTRVIWSSPGGRAGRYGALRRRPRTRARPIRRSVRIAWLLTAIGLLRLARLARRRWQLLAGATVTVAGVLLRGDAWGVILLPGLMLLLSVPLVPVNPDPDRGRRCQLVRELAAYTTMAQRCDLEATLDRYPDSDTHELRDILAGQARTGYPGRIPGSGNMAPGRR